MLDFLRRSATSLFAWLIIGVLALVFGLSFGLPSDSGFAFGAKPFVQVHGEKIGEDEYRNQFNLLAHTVGIPSDPQFQELVGVKEEVIDTAVERELLVAIARDLGLDATARDAEDLTADGHIIAVGETWDWLGDMGFNYDVFVKNFLARLQMPEPRYLELQRRELLARTMRDVVRSSVVVTEGELWEAYAASANRLSLHYARYSPGDFAELVDPAPEQVQAWLAEHRGELQAELETLGTRFTKLPAQARLWVVEIPKPSSDDETSQAKRRAASALSRIRGGEAFASVARETSAHGTARSGGDYGWVTEGSGSGLDPVVDEMLTQLEIGEISEVLEGSDAFFVIRVSGRREGDVPEEEALIELAEEAVAKARGRELAREAAQADLAAALEGKPIARVFDAPGALGVDGGIEDVGVEEDEDEARQRVALRETGLFSRDEPVPGLGPQPELVTAAWEAGTETPLVNRVFEVGDDLVLAGLARKDEASEEGFANEREALYEQALMAKSNGVLARWAARRCIESRASGDIVVSEDIIRRVVTYDTKLGENEQGQRTLKPYSVCDRVGQQGGLLRAGQLQGMGGM
jgi:peptidyl-prolyl cis-trans isomerase D